LLLAIGCAGSGNKAADSGVSVLDASLPEVGAEAAGFARADARPGLASGAACDSSAQCLSGACTLGTCSDWAHAMRIGIDTTPDGADIEQAVTGFPLLVRLDKANFIFAQARPDGADVRFVDEAGQSLSHEIERWDGKLGLAQVWVSVPRIEAGRKDNVVVMYWGNPLAAQISSGPAVFGTFAGVLHMGAATDGIAFHLQDSSGQGNTAIMQNWPSDPSSDGEQSEGIAGPGLALDGQGEYLAGSTRLMSPPTFAISLWLKTTSAARAGIAGFASQQSGNDIRFDRAIWMDERGRLSFGVLRTSTLVMVSSLTGYNDGAWHHVVGRFSGNGQYLFVDGESIADDPTRSGANSYPGLWCFGEDPTAVPAPATSGPAIPAGSTFAGMLDEIQVATAAPSDAWIKLAYATQRPDTSAVSYQTLP
jgi:biopolymer transport protein ExbB